ncbi:MAG TPA: hypothetical protein VF794_01780 [Archangium sp.]|uniref:hypothetical protein n=1 Tax=Archangium sp. TaxID=1872627 RepID=UPI002EDB095C
MKNALLPLAFALLATSALAKDQATFRYTPPKDAERPMVVEGMAGPQGGDFALRLLFDKLPFGKDCGRSCANVTLLLDTDDNPRSGLRLGSRAAETGADLAILIQGTRDFVGTSGENYLRVKVRRLSDDARSVDDGELLTELDHRRDPERIHIEDKTVFLLIDASSNLPSGRKVRIIYHPPGSRALQATMAGMLSGSATSGKVMIFRRGGWGKAPQGGQRIGTENK